MQGDFKYIMCGISTIILVSTVAYYGITSELLKKGDSIENFSKKVKLCNGIIHNYLDGYKSIKKIAFKSCLKLH